MDWINELDKYGYNFLIDELVWHLEQGKIPTDIIKREKDGLSGCEFLFENEQPRFLQVIPELLDEHWKEAQKITASFPQIASIKYVVG